jgi:YVTN family beta-propeller protein
VYAANYGSSSVSVIDSSSNSVITTITGITSANGVAYDPTNNIIWVTNYSRDQVTPIQANSDATGFTVLSPVTVGDGPWGVAYDLSHDYLYVVNNLGNSLTVINAGTRGVTGTLSGSFSQPYHVAANPVTGKVYVTNFGDHSVTVVNGTSVSGAVNLNTADPSLQPYGVAVDETRNLVYVATVSSHRVVAIDGATDALLGWAAFHRGFGDPARPVPMRVVAVNPGIGPSGDGGHVWTTTSANDGSEADQALLIPKGWSSYFHTPVPCDVGINPAEGLAIDRTLNRAYVTSGTDPGAVTVFEDYANPPLVPFSTHDGIGLDLFIVP